MSSLNIYWTLEYILGRRFLWRLGRFFYLGARRELSAAPEKDGEFSLQRWMVQDFAANGREPVIFDVGANLGLWTLNLASVLHDKRVGGSRIYAFEPAPDQRAELSNALKDAPGSVNVVVNESALSSETGEGEFVVTGRRTGTSHLAYDNAETGSALFTFKVKIDTIDEYINRNGINYIDLIKIDTEGNDYNVIAGASNAISRNYISVVQFEYGSHWIDARHSPKGIMELAKRNGYRFGKLTSRNIEIYEDWHPELDRFILANFVLLSPNAPKTIPCVIARFDRFNTCEIVEG